MDSLVQLRIRVIRASLRGLVRLCLRWAIRVPEVTEIIKESFLELAREELERRGEKVNASKLSVMTGIHRKFISTDKPGEEPRQRSHERSILTKVIGHWRNSSKYSRKGTPRLLTCVGAQSEFALLVGEIVSDLNPYTVLFEMERLKLVKRVGEKLKLEVSFLNTKADAEKTLTILESDMARLGKAISENTSHTQEEPNLHLTTEFDAIPESALPELRQWLLVQGSKFHAEARAKISSFDKDLNPHLRNAPGLHRVSVTAFSLIEKTREDE